MSIIKLLNFIELLKIRHKHFWPKHEPTTNKLEIKSLKHMLIGRNANFKENNMISEIGELSGVIWRLLDEKGALTVTKIKNTTKENDFNVAVALGWLAREDKVEIGKSGRSIKVSLK